MIISSHPSSWLLYVPAAKFKYRIKDMFILGMITGITAMALTAFVQSKLFRKLRDQIKIAMHSAQESVHGRCSTLCRGLLTFTGSSASSPVSAQPIS